MRSAMLSNSLWMSKSSQPSFKISYSELLIRTVSSFFKKKTDIRPDFKQVYNLLEPYSIKIQKLEPFNIDLRTTAPPPTQQLMFYFSTPYKS
jgi:hypothetical protein